MKGTNVVLATPEVGESTKEDFNENLVIVLVDLIIIIKVKVKKIYDVEKQRSIHSNEVILVSSGEVLTVFDLVNSVEVLSNLNFNVHASR